jgi:hypothetical protein
VLIHDVKPQVAMRENSLRQALASSLGFAHTRLNELAAKERTTV